MSRSKRILCGALACLIACSMAFAEEPSTETAATPAPTETTAPVETAAPVPTETAATETPVPISTETPEPTEEETSEPTADPTATVEPTPSPEAVPTASPETEPTASPEVTPTVEPTSQLEISIAGYEQPTDDGIYRITAQSPEDQIAFQWQLVELAASYQVRITDSLGSELYLAQQTETVLSLPVSTFGTDTCVLHVQAYSSDQLLAEEMLLEGEVRFMLAQGEGGMFPGGFPSGGFPGGGGFSGGMSAAGGMSAGAMPEEAQGFHVTPGEALTDSHSSGTKDMQLYGTVALETSEETMSVLTLGDTELAVSLDDQAGFTAELEDGCLTLIPEGAGEAWSLNGLALKTLSRSGVGILRLMIDGTAVEIPTQPSLQGSEYGRLCAQGYVSKDYELTVTKGGMTVSVADKIYTINENSELVGG